MYTHTVVGLFDSDFDAQDAVDELMRHKIARKDIDVNNRLDVHDPSFENEHERYHHDPVKYKAHETGFSAFFENLFGKGVEEAERYTKVAVEGCTVITVYTRSEEDAARVADLLDNKGAIDVNERASKYGHMPNTKATGTTGTKSPANAPGIDSTGPGGFEEVNQVKSNAREPGEDETKIPPVEERSGPGNRSMPASDRRSKSRIVKWSGDEALQVREHRSNEPKFW